MAKPGNHVVPMRGVTQDRGGNPAAARTGEQPGMPVPPLMTPRRRATGLAAFDLLRPIVGPHRPEIPVLSASARTHSL